MACIACGLWLGLHRVGFAGGPGGGDGRPHLALFSNVISHVRLNHSFIKLAHLLILIY